MEEDTFAQGLHDKSTRGAALTPDERTRLDAWYGRQDALEEALLNSRLLDAAPLAQAHAETEEALAHLQSESQMLKVLTEENDALRRENAALARRLTQTDVPQAA